MINKQRLQSIISKYHLNGLTQSVKWDTKEGKLDICFVSDNKDLAGDVKVESSPVEDSELAIFDTSQLNKLISVTNGDLLLTLEKNHKVYSKLYIEDSSFNVAYNLADSLLIPKRGNINFPENYDVIINLNTEVVDNLIKAKNALSGISDMMITTIEDEDRGKVVEFSFGDRSNYSNKIRYTINEEIDIKQDIKLPFNSDLFKEILNSNKDLESGKISISEEGFMKLEFCVEDINSMYYMVRKEDSTYV